jgi:hypothetical protein
MSTGRVKKHYLKLKALSLAVPKLQKKIVSRANRDLVDCISECCKNVLRGNVTLSVAQKSKLDKHKKKLRFLSLKRAGLKKRKRIIQTGGFLGALLTPVVAFLGSMLLNQ